MRRFRVVISGSGTLIPRADDGPPIVAVTTTRFVRAASETEASDRALQLVLTSWHANESLRTCPTPQFSVAFIAQVKSPFKRSRPNGGWCFATDDEALEAAIELEEEASRGWFL